MPWSRIARLVNNICQREKVSCEVLGEVTGDGKIVLIDSENDSTPVSLELAKILGDMPKKTFSFDRIDKKRTELKLPKGLTVAQALRKIFKLPSVGSKGFLVRKVDRSVTGLIAQQQCCGPMQIPISDVAVVAQSHFGLTGAATSIGEQPIKMLVNPAAGARMAVAEMLTNIAGARITNLADIKCSGNWMAPAKLAGEGAVMYDAAIAARDLMIELGIAIDGGKDSLSMAAKVEGEMVKAPTELVISGYATMNDVTKVVTPDIKRPGESMLMLLDLECCKYRLGGSALAQALKQIGNESPDVDVAVQLSKLFNAVQYLVDKGLILAIHDRSDGGLITTVMEMTMAKGCGFLLSINHQDHDVFSYLFSEEVGFVVEYLPENKIAIEEFLDSNGLFSFGSHTIGYTTKATRVDINYNGNSVFTDDIRNIRRSWESTSFQLERLQTNPDKAREEWLSHTDTSEPCYKLTYNPKPTALEILQHAVKPKVAILREEGSNGDREMASAFFSAGFEPWDVTMTDLLNGTANLDQFNMVAFVGGFSYADVLDSAKGWAGVIKFNDRLKEQFRKFYHRPDTLSLGVCNGCQLMALLGWVPGGNLPDDIQPRFIQNASGRFESRWASVQVQQSKAVMFKGMEGSILGVPIAHGEGRLHFPVSSIMDNMNMNDQIPLAYVSNVGMITDSYPANPNGSPHGFTALCSPDGRHLAMMPHPERAFLKWQWHWMPEEWKQQLTASPWLQLFQNAYSYFK